jgi:hypothetical protein
VGDGAKELLEHPLTELDQITTENVDRLQLAWTFSVGVDRGQEAAPLIIDNTMYVFGPHPNNLFASMPLRVISSGCSRRRQPRQLWASPAAMW